MLPKSRLSTLAAAALLSVALPAVPALAKEKTKTKPAAEASASSFDYSVSIPGIEAVGSSMDEAALTDVFSGEVAEHAEELAALDADSITVPAITVSFSGVQDGERYDAELTLTDLVLEDVIDGVAGSMSLAGSAMNADEADFEYGAMSAANVDIGALLGIFGLVQGTGSEELKTIYTDFTAEGGTTRSDEVNCTFGAMSSANIKARPLKTSLIEFVALAEQLEEQDPDEVHPALMGKMMHMYADLLTAFEFSESSFDGVSCEGVEEDGTEISFSLGGMHTGAMTVGTYPEISMDGFTVEVKDEGSFSLDNFTIKPMDLTNVLETLQNAPDEVDDAWVEANARGLIPAMEGFSMSGLDIDVPNSENEGQRVQVAIGGIDLTLGNWLNGIPAEADLSAQNIQAAVPENTGDETIEQLRALGVTDIDAGFRVAMAWDEATSSIDIEEVSVTGAELATVTLSGTIANATADLFSEDADASLSASMALAVKAMTLDIVDEGLTDIVIAAVAANQGGDPEQLRPIYADLAKGTVISLLAGVADAAKVGDALSTFIAGRARSLQIALEAKKEPGIGMEDFMAAESDPTRILRQVNISASTK